MDKLLKLPVGIENFREIRESEFYYIDKTKLIEQLLTNGGKVSLFTRPRRFGKTLNMSMLRYFFSIETDKKLFDGLYISQNKELCDKYLGQYPVIFLSLKGVEGLTFKDAAYCFAELMEERLTETKEWYDGYHFGDADIYCPWDVINHVDRLKAEPKAKPQAYWLNTSGNGLVKRFVDKANKTTRVEIEQLIAGEAVEKFIRLDLTYDEIDKSIDNLWSVLFMTGYLTQVGMTDEGAYKLVIPNKEIREVYKLQIQE